MPSSLPSPFRHQSSIQESILSPTFSQKLDTYFQITNRNSTITTELRSGLSSFLTISYILLINPQIMSKAGIPSTDVVFATALGSAIATFMTGVFGNLPFGLAPGLGLSAYLVYGLILNDVLSISEAMTSCLLSGLLQAFFALTGISRVIMRIVPRSIKLSIVVGMGFLVAFIGMISIKLVVGNTKTLVALGDLTSSLDMQVSLLGVIVIGSLVYHNVKGGILIGIAILTVTFWRMNGSFPSQIIELPKLQNSPSFYLTSTVFTDMAVLKRMFPAIVSFTFIGLFDISGVIFGLSALSDLLSSDGHTTEGSIWVFLSSSCGTAVCSMMGCSPVIVTVESAVGIKEGGRTGLTAVTVSALFLLSLCLAPLLGAVPQEATAPVLVIVGAMMMGESKNVNWEEMDSAIPAFLTIVMMPLTYSITNGIVFGLGSSLCFYFTTGKFFEDITLYFRPSPSASSSNLDNDKEIGQDNETTPFNPTNKNKRIGERQPSFSDNEVVVIHPTFFSKADNMKVDEYERNCHVDV